MMAYQGNTGGGYYGAPNAPQPYGAAPSQSQQQMGGPGSMDPFMRGMNVSPEMLNFGLTAGQDMLNKQRDRLMPGMSTLWTSLKIYFAVNNEYVARKLFTIIHPLKKRKEEWRRKGADETMRTDENDVTDRKWALPRYDVNAPDLYIPLMSFITYVLLFGLCKGLGSSNFSPEILIQAIWRSLIVQALEVCGIKVGLTLMQVPLPWLDIFAYTGYKYVGLCLNSLARVIVGGGYLSTLASLYTSCMLAYFVMKTLSAVVDKDAVSAQAPVKRHVMIFSFAASQFVVSLLLAWY
jgi:hypothetical protein